MKFPSAGRIVVGVAIALIAVWAANNVPAIQRLVAPRA